MAEEYQQIEGFNDYEVSNMGNVRNANTGRVLRPSNGSGYCVVILRRDGKSVSKNVHELVAKTFIHNPENKPCVDHINGNKLDNNVNNLRYATKRENSRNAKLSKANTSGVKGITFDKKSKKWLAQIMINGRNIYIGRFRNIEDAKQARVNKANIAFGEFVNVCERI